MSDEDRNDDLDIDLDSTDTPTDTTDAPTPRVVPPGATVAPAAGTVDWEQEAARLRGELAKARKWEKTAKSNSDAARRLAEIEEAQKTAEEKARDALQRSEAARSAALERVARAEVKAALTGIVEQPDTILDDLNLRRFLTDDGDVDEDAVAALRAKYEAIAPPRRRAPEPNPAQGVNGSKEHEKPLTAADLKRMTTEEINKARREGKLDQLMGRRPSLTR